VSQTRSVSHLANLAAAEGERRQGEPRRPRIRAKEVSVRVLVGCVCRIESGCGGVDRSGCEDGDDPSLGWPGTKVGLAAFILASVAGESALPIVERSDVPVLFKRCTDEQAAITRAWADLEQAVGTLRGRKFYGVFDPVSHEYRACAELREGDDPRRLGLELGALAGGRYARVRLTGDPPAVYALIAPAMERLARRPDSDPGRPSVEFYRRRDVIDLLQPVV
jgi:hypothetical protein